MMRNTLLIFTICLFFNLNTLQGQNIEERFESSEAHNFALELLGKLNLEEKVSLLSGMGTSRSEFGDRGVPYFGIKGIPEKGIPDFIMGHGITGVRTGRDLNTHSTYFGTPIAMACSWDLDLY